MTNQVSISFKDSYDLDNLTLTYNVFRGATNISSQKFTTYYWQTRKTITVVDKGVKKGQSVSYHVEIHDGRNIMKGPAIAVKVK